MERVEDKEMSTLLKMIEKWIEPGTLIISKDYTNYLLMEKLIPQYKSKMIDASCLFDSEEEEDDESKKKTPEERKFIFRRELRAMLYGFGDEKQPAENTLEVLEQIVMDYIREVCRKALEVGKPNRINLEDIHYLIRRDQKKFGRVKELLSLSEELKRARKAFDDCRKMEHNRYGNKRHGGVGRPHFLRPIDDDAAATIVDEGKLNLEADQTSSIIYHNPFLALSIQQQRQRLPISKYRNQLLYLVEKYKTVVVVGETGSGKSTQLPQYLAEFGWAQEGKKICITQPRRVAAVTLANRVAEEMMCSLGSEVGYAVRFDECISDKTKIKYVTDGLLLRELMSDPLLEAYSVVIIDEAHERSVNSDLVIGLLRKIIAIRDDLRIIVSSATIEAELFRDFFELNEDYKNSDKNTAAIISVEGRMFPVNVFYTKVGVPDYVQTTVDTILRLHREEPSGDILAFLTGQDEVEQACKLLEGSIKSLPKDLDKLLILPLYGGLSPKEQFRAFESAPYQTRKSVITTNIAETSVTITGIVYVIDCGFVKIRVFDSVDFCFSFQGGSGFGNFLKRVLVEEKPGYLGNSKHPWRAPLNLDRQNWIKTNFPTSCVSIQNLWAIKIDSKIGMESLVVIPCSKSSAEQRAGRAGRLRPGKCFRLYPESEFKKLSNSTIPEIQRGDLSSVILRLKALGVQNVLRFNYLSRPSSAVMVQSLQMLNALKAIDDDGLLTNPLGFQMAELPLSPMHAKALISSAEFECSKEIATIISMMQIRDVFNHPIGSKHKAEVNKRSLSVEEGDHLTLLNIFDLFIENGRSQNWCQQNFLNYKALCRAEFIRQQFIGFLKNANLKINSCKGTIGETAKIRRALLSGFFSQVAYYDHRGLYVTLKGEHAFKIYKGSVLMYRKEYPKWVLFTDVMQSSIKDLSEIDPKWLEQIAPHYYEFGSDLQGTKRRKIDDNNFAEGRMANLN
uniref:RNA helicase n=1 Tax=Meloidogyne incognita TaxID=6306 RepID=A0A914LDT8_MELIC